MATTTCCRTRRTRLASILECVRGFAIKVNYTLCRSQWKRVYLRRETTAKAFCADTFCVSGKWFTDAVLTICVSEAVPTDTNRVSTIGFTDTNYSLRFICVSETAPIDKNHVGVTVYIWFITLKDKRPVCARRLAPADHQGRRALLGLSAARVRTCISAWRL